MREYFFYIAFILLFSSFLKYPNIGVFLIFSSLRQILYNGFLGNYFESVYFYLFFDVKFFTIFPYESWRFRVTVLSVYFCNSNEHFRI